MKNTKETEGQKIKCKEYFNVDGERIILNDHNEQQEGMSFYQWEKEIKKLISKSKLSCHFQEPEEIEDDIKPYLDPAIKRRIERNREDPERFPLDRHEHNMFENYKKDKTNWKNSCAELLNMIMDCVCVNIRNKIELMENYDEKSRENIIRIMRYLKNSFGGFTANRNQQITDSFNKLKPIQSVKELDKFIKMIYECQREKISWNNRREGNFQYRNKEIIQIVINKLIEWDKLNDCIKTIKKDRNILSWEEEVEILEKESSEIKADYEVTINNNRENNSCSNDTSSGNGRNNNKHMTNNSDNNTDMDSASILTQSMVNYVRDIKSTNSAKCYNCNNFGHLSSACKATYCNKCKRSWNSINDPGYHTSYCCKSKPTMIIII